MKFSEKLLINLSVISGLLSIPSLAIAREVRESYVPIAKTVDTHRGITPYIEMRYFGEFFQDVGDFKNFHEDSGVTSEKVVGISKGSSSDISPRDYKNIDYTHSIFAGGLSVGYRAQGISRIELEVSISNIKIDTTGYNDESQARYVELTRMDYLGANPQNDINVPPSNIEKVIPNFSQIVSITSPPISQQQTSIPGKTKLAFVAYNAGFLTISGMINSYLDFKISDSIPLFPYVGIGAGVATIKFLDQWFYPELVYQWKAGLGYELNKDQRIFIGYKYFSRLGHKFEKIQPAYAIPAVPASAVTNIAAQKSSTTGSLQVDYASYGLEVGFQTSF